MSRVSIVTVSTYTADFQPPIKHKHRISQTPTHTINLKCIRSNNYLLLFCFRKSSNQIYQLSLLLSPLHVPRLRKSENKELNRARYYIHIKRFRYNNEASSNSRTSYNQAYESTTKNRYDIVCKKTIHAVESLKRNGFPTGFEDKVKI